MPTRRRIRPPRFGGTVKRPRRPRQAGGQLGLIASVLAPLIATEVARFGIQRGIKKVTGTGAHGSGLLLAGQKRGGRRGGRRRNGTRKFRGTPVSKAVMARRMAAIRAAKKPRRRKRQVRTLPFILPPQILRRL